jgi:hypothetical protein
MTLTTAAAILAIDFPAFPRRLGRAWQTSPATHAEPSSLDFNGMRWRGEHCPSDC